MRRVYSKLLCFAALTTLVPPFFHWQDRAIAAGTTMPSIHLSSRSSPLAPAAARMTFRRVFKSSTPEFIEITIREDSDQATFDIRQLDEDPEKLQFEVGAPLRAKMFELAGELRRGFALRNPQDRGFRFGDGVGQRQPSV